MLEERIINYYILLELLPTGVVLDTGEGRTFIPAKVFDQEASILLDNQ